MKTKDTRTVPDHNQLHIIEENNEATVANNKR